MRIHECLYVCKYKCIYLHFSVCVNVCMMNAYEIVLVYFMFIA